jgi:hypothetical protein
MPQLICNSFAKSVSGSFNANQFSLSAVLLYVLQHGAFLTNSLVQQLMLFLLDVVHVKRSSVMELLDMEAVLMKMANQHLMP